MGILGVVGLLLVSLGSLGSPWPLWLGPSMSNARIPVLGQGLVALAARELAGRSNSSVPFATLARLLLLKLAFLWLGLLWLCWPLLAMTELLNHPATSEITAAVDSATGYALPRGGVLTSIALFATAN